MRPRDEAREQLTSRVPKDVHGALKVLSVATGEPVNDIVLRAIRDYLADEGHRQAVRAFAREAQEKYRVALDKLADL